MAARISRPPELLHGKRGRLAHDTVATSQGVHLATQRLNPDPVQTKKSHFPHQFSDLEMGSQNATCTDYRNYVIIAGHIRAELLKDFNAFMEKIKSNNPFM